MSEFSVKLNLVEGYQGGDESTRKLFWLSVCDQFDATNHTWYNYDDFNGNPIDDGRILIKFFEMGYQKALEGKKYDIKIDENAFFQRRETK